MEKSKLDVDCWVFPRVSVEGSCSLRYALYRLLVQGVRRCLGLRSLPVILGDLTPTFRQFYSGKPMWTTGKVTRGDHPDGYVRDLDPDTGAFFWTIDGQALLDSDGRIIWDTVGLWADLLVRPPESAPAVDQLEPRRPDAYVEEDTEDIYGAS